jgi:hypothetical protein
MTLIGIAPNRLMKGVKTAAAVASATKYEVLDLFEALEKKWNGEALFCMYRPIGTTSPWPRYTKQSLPSLLAAGTGVELPVLAIDWDLPDHRAWKGGEWSQTVVRIRQVPLSHHACAIYETAHGFRAVYRLATPVSPATGEGLLGGLIQHWGDHGFAPDAAASDWTRLFYLPQVRRGAGDTYGTQLLVDRDQTWDPAQTGTKPVYGKLALASTRPSADTGAPTDAAVLALRDDAVGRTIRSRIKKHCLADYEAAYEGAALHMPVGRDVSLLDSVGRCFRHVLLANGTVEHLYAVMWEIANGLEPSEAVADWHAEAWRKCVYVWDREAQARRELEEWREDQVAAKTATMLETVQTWHPEADAEWISRHMILNHSGKAYFLLGKEGWYEDNPVDRSTIAARARELGLEDLIELWSFAKDGTRRLRPIANILYEHSSSVFDVVGTLDREGSYLKDGRLCQLMYRRRRDLRPTYCSEVDQWLKMLVTSNPDTFENAAKLQEWIGFALWFELGTPIAALSLIGPPGIGKKLLVQGLSECINTQAIATSEEFGNFQQNLVRTPFLHLNEGIHTGGAKDPSQLFRELSGGDPLSVNRKFQPSVVARNPLRIIMTANNDRILRAIAGKNDLSNEDRDALAIRLLTFRGRPEASRWLEIQGGRQFTRGWIHSDSGTGSDYKVAKHFLWLHEQVKATCTPSPRLLVEGQRDNTIVASLTTQSGSAPIVTETLLSMIQAHSQTPSQYLSMDPDAQVIYTTSHGVVEHFRVTLYQYVKQAINESHVEAVCRSFRPEGMESTVELTEKSVRTVMGDRAKVRAKWIPLDPNKLLAQAHQKGYTAYALDQFVGTTAAAVEEFEGGKQL